MLKAFKAMTAAYAEVLVVSSPILRTLIFSPKQTTPSNFLNFSTISTEASSTETEFVPVSMSTSII